MTRLLNLVLVLLVVAAGFAAVRLLEASLATEVYRERLAEMSADYETLRGRYNEAVRRTAVTELVVEGDTLTVVIRTAEGELQSLRSPYDPSREIYVDYVVLDGRLWIRRLFDDATAPEEGMIVDPRFVDVDWDAEGESHGKAAYRSLTPGRWVVDVTGDGSLGLARRDDDVPVRLAPPPEVRRYEAIEGIVAERLGAIRASEAVSALARQLR
ncbi:MAG: hypothetical protein ACI8W3_002041 [Myxococcota bacterium]|jgi:hypothetical protein